MKKILFLSVFLLGLYNATGQNYYMTAPEGFGAATTGAGVGASSITVSTYTAFKNAIKAAGAKVILVSGTIDCVYTSELVVNKTIVGLPGARLRNLQITVGDATTSANNSGILNLKPGSNNVIIRNLIFEGPGAYDVDGKDNLTADGCTNLWVDHCEFQDGMDGNFDNKGLTDNVTISWCKFTYLKPATPRNVTNFTNDHRFSDLIGSDSGDKPSDGHYSITFKNCYWAEGCKERMPRARNAELHILNCYYNTSVSGALAMGLGGGDNSAVTTCYVENTNFAKVANVYKSYTSDDGGTVKLTYDGSVKGIPSTSIANSGTATKPTYTYTVLSVADVATYVPNVTCGAGATLQVTAAGVISTSCPNLGVEDYALNNSIKLYPTFVDNTLNIDLSDAIAGDATVEIYSVSGSKIFSYAKKNVSSNEKLSLDLPNLSKGMYLCTLSIGGSSTTLKFIKE